MDEDEPLFLSLINDLFPGITLSKAGYPELEGAIERQAQEAGLIAHPPWVLKLIQVFILLLLLLLLILLIYCIHLSLLIIWDFSMLNGFFVLCLLFLYFTCFQFCSGIFQQMFRPVKIKFQFLHPFKLISPPFLFAFSPKYCSTVG